MLPMKPLKISAKAERTSNPIRKIVDNLQPAKNHPQPLLNLSLGDPTAFGNHLKCPSAFRDSVIQKLILGDGNGYLQSAGGKQAREAVASYTSLKSGVNLTYEDVLITSGCSGAIELAISVLLNEGDNILVPRPGFPLYTVITESLGGHVKTYPLLPDKNWLIDLSVLESLIDIHTKAILINNPSNPCGCNYSKCHLLDILSLAKKYHIPIISDEIYGDMVFEGSFYPLQALSDNEVPILTLGGIAKQFLVPGWRLGWILIHDTNDYQMIHIRKGLHNLSQLVMGANSLIQSALPAVLCPMPQSPQEAELIQYKQYYHSILKENTQICANFLLNNRYFSSILPHGALYILIRLALDQLSPFLCNDTIFSERLLKEENVVVLPGQCFGIRDHIRLVICSPKEMLMEALTRMIAFCERYDIRRNTAVQIYNHDSYSLVTQTYTVSM